MITLPAPAKLNLFLHIVGRRTDGYHELQTLFQFIDYSDELSFELRDEPIIQVQCNDESIDTQNNLVYRAAIALQHHQKKPQGVVIHLKKNIPIGAGLGGGSSDAATTLLALNKLWQLNFSQNELLQIGRKLGADVPIFIDGHAAFGEGIGDILYPYSPPEKWYLVVVPPIAIQSIDLYKDPELPRHTPSIDLQHYQFEQTHNDFECLVNKRYPLVREGIYWLKQYAPTRLTGSGSCFFGVFNKREQAAAVQQHLPSPYWSFIAKACNVSPLHLALDQLA